MKEETEIFWPLVIIAAILTPFAAWLTHLYVCFKTGSWGFLVAGAIAFPIGVIHGIGHWIRVW